MAIKDAKPGDRAFYPDDGIEVEVVGSHDDNMGMLIVRPVSPKGPEFTVEPDELEPIAPQPKTKAEHYAAALGIKPEVIEPIELNTIPGTVKVHLDSEELAELASLRAEDSPASYDLWMERLAGVDVLMVEVQGDHDPERWLIVGGGKVRLGR